MTKKSTRTIVHLRVYKGQKMSYDENGKPQNENHVVKLPHPSIEWNNFLKYLGVNAYCKVEVEKVTEVEKPGPEETIEEVKDIASFKEEVANAFNPKEVVVETEDQKRIKALEEIINQMKGGKAEKKTESKEKTTSSDAKDLRAEYRELYGKNPGPRWDDEKVAEMIAAKKAE